MMLDADIVGVSPASVWRVLSSSGTAAKVEREALKKKRDRRFDQPPPHQHWHIDVSYLNVCATFYYVAARRILRRDLG
ncbi:MAG: hypothetical protein WBV55_23425 [Candidatus Sulfotelmatobacter sp.]